MGVELWCHCVCVCSSTERKVSLSRTTATGCYPIKIIGGKSVGVFVSDVRSDVTQV